MPSYYYHLSLELASSPPPTFKSANTTQARDIYLPPPDTDIFDSVLPAQTVPTWQPPPKQHKRSKTVTSSDETTRSLINRPNYARRLSHLHLTPAERANSPVPYSIIDVSKSTPPSPNLDWRFDAVCIRSIDMVETEMTDSNIRPVTAVGVATGDGLSTKGRFVPGAHKDTEVGWGVVHLYRDEKETPGLYDDACNNASENGQAKALCKDAFDEVGCDTLCILAVPSYMTPSDFLGFVGEKTRDQVSHFRLIRSGTRNKYMVLIKFRNAKDARVWRKDWNGKLFNSMEPENCHVVFVKSIVFQTPDSYRDPSNFPNNTNDPFTPAPGPKPVAPLPAPSPVEASTLATLSTKPMAPPTPSLVELPTCPVCLERMDETTGLLTILCQHVFHCACLEKWRGTGCPVCRYTQTDALGFRGGDEDDATENECSVCGTTSNLWICLVCGNVGCGRYDDAHAHAHYQATSHAFAMDVTTQHVWDYAGDGYVHRLIQNKADGKLVDLPAAHSHNANAGMTAYGEEFVPREKVDNMAIEYTYLLTSQLDSQRSYYDSQLERATDKATKAIADAEQATESLAASRAELLALKEAHKASQTQLTDVEKVCVRQTQRASTSSELARKMTSSYREEKTMNEALMTRIKFLEESYGKEREKVERAELEKAELAEQVRDLTFFISSQERLKALEGEAGDEVREGFVEVPKEEGGSGKGRRKGKGKK